MLTKKSSLVLLSGGQDSTTCLYWSKQNFSKLVCLNIWYGQRHEVEIEAARKIASLAGLTLNEFRTNIFRDIDDSALLSDGDISCLRPSSDNLPASFVPGRNIVFLTIAAAIAYKFGIRDLVTGVCQTDFSGYPDCRDNTIKSLQVTLSLAFGQEMIIHAPLMWMTKAETVKLACNLPGCMEALSWSHTCYEGKYPPCGKCPACLLRTKGFSEAGIADPIFLRSP